MIDARTAVLVTAALASPWLLQAGAAAGVPIPVYITGGQRAALAAFPATVDGVSTAPQGTARADTQSIYAKWNAVNTALLAQNGAAQIAEYSNPLWNPTNLAKLTTAQSQELGNAVLAAAAAGFQASSEPYWHTSGLVTTTVTLPDEYLTLQSMLEGDAGVWGSTEGDDTSAITLAILRLVVACDQEGYLPTGKPFTPTLAGGFDAAASAVGDFVTNLAGKAAGGAATLAIGAALSTPGLVLMAGVLLWKVYR